jgi:hypothetical protein
MMGGWLNLAPTLPGTELLRLALPLMWAVVLAGVALRLGRHAPVVWRRGLAVVLALWALLPGPLSVTYWLGLAFQLPSLTATVLCALWLWPARLPRTESVGALGLAAVLLGWVLLLDAFAVWPVSVYALGFGTGALAWVSAGVAVLAVGVRGQAGQMGGWMPVAAALALFAATRLPTGNVWDALLDPWLWLVLQGMALRQFYLPNRP